MRISDWSSDVCSSDRIGLAPFRHGADAGAQPVRALVVRPDAADLFPRRARRQPDGKDEVVSVPTPDRHTSPNSGGNMAWRMIRMPSSTTMGDRSRARSEEHTSELQSLMRISY